MNDGCQCAFANVVVRNIIVQCFVFFGYVILRLHRFSRVVHREPSVPSALYKGPTLYEDRDNLRRVVVTMRDRVNWLQAVSLMHRG